MSYRESFSDLRELFPQVDVRILKAVAIEHKKDIDAAVEFILSDVLPFLDTQRQIFHGGHVSEEVIGKPDDGRHSKHDSQEKGGTRDTILDGPPTSLRVQGAANQEPANYLQSNSISHTSSSLGVKGAINEEPATYSVLLQDGESSGLATNVEYHITHVKAPPTGDPICIRSLPGNSDIEALETEGNSIHQAGQFSESYTPLSHVEYAMEFPMLTSVNHTVVKDGFPGNPDHLCNATNMLLKFELEPGNTASVSADMFPPSTAASGTLSGQLAKPDVLEDSTNDVAANEEPAKYLQLNSLPYLTSSFGFYGSANEEPINYLHINSRSFENGKSSVSATNAEDQIAHVKAPPVGDSLSTISVPDNSYVESPEAVGNLVHQVGLGSEAYTSSSHADEYEVAFPMLPSGNHIVVEDGFPDNADHLCNDSNVPFKYELEPCNPADVSPHLTVETWPGQIAKTDLLEDSINDAKTYKNTLLSNMLSVLVLAKVVEDKEREALEAKEEASKAGLDSLSKAEDLRKTLISAKEANHIHAGEVYGERSILATEARELHTRLLSLADQKEKSLSVIQEMHGALELRLATAEAEKVAAETLKLEKEDNALSKLVEQEIILNGVIEESKRLKQEAEENSKLREFLLDRGKVVDMLQGEMAVVCEDVRLMMERVNKLIPLGSITSLGRFPLTSLSSSSTSTATVANGSAGSAAGDHIPPEGDIASKEASSRVESAVPKDDQPVSSEDDWDLFEDAKEARNTV